MNVTNKFQIFAYYLLGIVVLCIFAMRSFSSELSQTGFSLILSIAAPFIVFGLIRGKLESIFVHNQKTIEHPKNQGLLDFSLFAIAGSVIVGTQFMMQEVSHFGLLKMFAWSLIIGYFAAIDSALYRMRGNFRYQAAQTVKPGEQPIELEGQTGPLAHRLNLFLSLTVLIVAVGMGISAYSYMSLDPSTVKQSTVDIRE